MTFVQRCSGSFWFGDGLASRHSGVRPRCSSGDVFEGVGVVNGSVDENVFPALEGLELGIFVEVFE